MTLEDYIEKIKNIMTNDLGIDVNRNTWITPNDYIKNTISQLVIHNDIIFNTVLYGYDIFGNKIIVKREFSTIYSESVSKLLIELLLNCDKPITNIENIFLRDNIIFITDSVYAKIDNRLLEYIKYKKYSKQTMNCLIYTFIPTDVPVLDFYREYFKHQPMFHDSRLLLGDYNSDADEAKEYYKCKYKKTTLIALALNKKWDKAKAEDIDLDSIKIRVEKYNMSFEKALELGKQERDKYGLKRSSTNTDKKNFYNILIKLLYDIMENDNQFNS